MNGQSNAAATQKKKIGTKNHLIILLGTGPLGTGPLGTGPLGTGPLGTGPLGTGPLGTGPLGTGLKWPEPF